MLDTIDRLKEKGKLIIFNTHYPEHALRYSNKVLMLNRTSGCRFGNTFEIITKENIEETYRIKAVVGEISDGKTVYKDIVPIKIV